MSISEIENILGTLKTRHPDLDAKMLETLLLAGGWDEPMRRDALALFKSGVTAIAIPNTPSAPKPVTPATIVTEKATDPVVTTASMETQIHNSLISPTASEDIVYITSDGHVEEDLSAVPASSNDSPVFIKETLVKPVVAQVSDNTVKPALQNENLQSVEALAVPPQEKQSLVIPAEEQPVQRKDTELPDNLPLVPFESAPNVWSFSKYKDVFYGEVMPAVNDEERHLKQKPVEEHILVEKVPLDRKDESLVVLAGTMLLVIIVLLGYMYSNGRL
jgi:hypothetical protein